MSFHYIWLGLMLLASAVLIGFGWWLIKNADAEGDDDTPDFGSIFDDDFYGF